MEVHRVYLYLYYDVKILINNNVLLYMYLDDIILIDTGVTESFCPPVAYPIDLKQTHNYLTNISFNFLDLKIYIKYIDWLLIDIPIKIIDFKLHINSFAYLHSCMHTSVFLNILISKHHLFKMNTIVCSSSFKNKNLAISVEPAFKHHFP